MDNLFREPNVPVDVPRDEVYVQSARGQDVPADQHFVRLRVDWMLQLLRAALGWEITLNGMIIPVWASWIAVAAALLLAWLGFSASRW